jgi:hypothetical protein
MTHFFENISLLCEANESEPRNARMMGLRERSCALFLVSLGVQHALAAKHLTSLLTRRDLLIYRV